ncbi:elongation factor P 5-aminopentanone reductase [Enterococcus sp. BWR-S5]|uniref:elongation factor P 5-aminopentanone reductase n=1 Tax=Enterococcus sp. BWR-S5 TaxID=2787714 RepID=UPI001923B6A3|nr:SDR family oxidoreductase [Enterococcus sp. BWR-S5]MBL1226847.1 SDR family oxidoreductase [Enterococcus sp. BWR-S5]
MKNALIMGASGGIGAAIAEELAAQGWSLYCHYHKNKEKVENLVRNFQNCYPQQDFFMVSLDMLDEAVLPTFFKQLFQVDAVVFASGFTRYGLLTDQTESDIDSLLTIHLKTPLLICQELQKKLSRSGHGRIVFIGSVYGQYGSSMEAVYSGVKGGQEAFVRAYSKEVASLGITVNTVAPGAVATAMNQQWTETEKRQIEERAAIGRMAHPAEVAGAAAFLLSDQAAYITGATIPINGGWY